MLIFVSIHRDIHTYTFFFYYYYFVLCYVSHHSMWLVFDHTYTVSEGVDGRVEEANTWSHQGFHSRSNDPQWRWMAETELSYAVTLWVSRGRQAPNYLVLILTMIKTQKNPINIGNNSCAFLRAGTKIHYPNNQHKSNRLKNAWTIARERGRYLQGLYLEQNHWQRSFLFILTCLWWSSWAWVFPPSL